MLTDLQKKTAQAVVNIFETGTPRGLYGSVTLIPGDAGHLTYGRSQTTLASGNLYLLIKSYCAAPGAQFATALTPDLPRLAARDTSLDMDMAFRGALHAAGDDPVMCAVQDQFFDRVYWNPSVQDATTAAVSSALGTNIVYDSHVQGAWTIIRDITNTNHGSAAQIGEQAWVSAYVSERRVWLATHPNPALHPTVYRMDAFLQLINNGTWNLPLPLTVRGILITEDVLSGSVALRLSAHAATEGTLQLETPPMQGDGVTALQQALVNAGFPVIVDGIVGPATRSALGL